ncbi:hypothetical protein [Microscilla marina]|uniref:Uncharacterized protein n=1 Tax=Microscilla marina ATCC 23134 TaxID=313606 RepID=A1ZRG3_MICM2|nr:hypothetical protein [Microscilla marina]EAY27053.1 conserved hypothetical protein [Microscilla marina ATCC 23134]
MMIELENLIGIIVKNNDLHARWLNSLSMMENTGARKISASEHPTQVNLTILKHAAEEARHAFLLKRQMSKLVPLEQYPTYEAPYLLAPVKSYQYLQALDVAASRYVKKHFQLADYDLKYAAYLLVTYAIEVRADELYPIYQKVLTREKSKIQVKAIIVEEEGHLQEMVAQLKDFSPEWEQHAEAICAIEGKLFTQWIAQVGKEVEQTALV